MVGGSYGVLRNILVCKENALPIVFLSGSRLEKDILRMVIDNKTSCGLICMYMSQK